MVRSTKAAIFISFKKQDIKKGLKICILKDGPLLPRHSPHFLQPYGAQDPERPYEQLPLPHGAPARDGVPDLGPDDGPGVPAGRRPLAGGCHWPVEQLEAQEVADEGLDLLLL